MMPHPNEEQTRVLAYELWERDGCPEGKDEQYWHAAEELLRDEGSDQLETDSATPTPIMPVPPTRL